MNLKLQTYILRLLVHKQMNVTLERKGNKYGGFIIATDRLSPNCTVLSFGIGRDISFDAAMMTEYQAQVYGFDPTPKSIIWVEKNINDRRFHFFPYGISDREESAVFYLPSNPANVSGSIVSHAHCEPRRYTPPPQNICAYEVNHRGYERNRSEQGFYYKNGHRGFRVQGDTSHS